MGVLAGRRERRQWLPEPPIAPYPGGPLPGVSSQPNVAVRPDAALVVPAVWACVNLLANTVSMMPLKTYRRPSTGDVPQRITDPQLVTSPADGMTQSEWLHALMVSLLLRGNGFGLQSAMGPAMRPTQVPLLNPDKVQIKVDPDTGTVRYLLGPNQIDITDRVWHVRGMTLPGSSVGLSPIAYAAQAIGVDLSSRKFAQNFFDGGGVPKAVLTSDMQIDQEQAQILKDRLRAATNNREPIALGSGVAYNAISVKPEESQFLETQQANISEIARFFNIPAEMVGGKTGSSLTYANVEQRSLDFLTYSVSFWLKRVEDAVSALLPAPQFVQFDTSTLLRTDAETQARVWAIHVASKIMPPSRILREMNEPALTEAEKQELELVPLTVTPTGMPRVNPLAAPGTGAASDIAPDVTPGQTKPKLGVVANG